MTIRFRVDILTAEGEQVYLTGSSPVLGKYDPDKAYRLAPVETEGSSGKIWSAEIQFDTHIERLLFYKYFIKDASGAIRYEAGGGRRLALNSSVKSIVTCDEWQPSTEETPFLTDPYAHVFYGANFSPYTQTHKKQYELIVRAVVPNIPEGYSIVMCGDSKELGRNNPAKGVKMSRLKGLKWIAHFQIEGMAGKCWKYRFAKVCDTTGEAEFEKGGMRSITLPELGKNDTHIVEHAQVAFGPRYPRFAGCTIPIFALRSRESCGIGEIGDLKLLVDWAVKCGIRILNILPLNDTLHHFNGADSSPYNCISYFGLNPIYLSLNPLGTLRDKSAAKEAAAEMRSLNHRAMVDYEDVIAFKMKYLRALYKEQGADAAAQPEYYKFVKENRNWLFSYAAFCALRDRYKSADFRTWKEHSSYYRDFEEALCTGSSKDKELTESARFYIYLQYNLHNQMMEAIDYAHSHGIALKGEFPMSISPDSVAAWKYPHYFDFGPEGGQKRQAVEESARTGASAPVFNWKEMSHNNYQWWRNRLRAMTDYYDMYSIGRIGRESGSSDNPYITQLLTQLVASSNMMACGKYSTGGEDSAGTELAEESEIVMKSRSIRKQLKDLHVLSLEVPKTKISGESYIGNVKPGYFSIFTTSTCNSKTLRMWLGKELGSNFYRSDDTGESFFDAGADDCRTAVGQALATPSMFAILPIQDWMSIDAATRNRFTDSERINNPDLRGWVWKYRLHITLEQLLEANSLNTKIRELITGSGR